MNLSSYREDLATIENIINILDETEIDIVYLDTDEEVNILNNLLNKIKLNVRDVLSIKELAGINNR